MKAICRLCALLLCVLLTLGMFTAALAASTDTDPTDIAEEFKRLLNADGIKYLDVGLDAGGSYELVVVYPGFNLSNHKVTVLIQGDGEGFSACERDLMSFDLNQLAAVAMNINMIHLQYGHVIFGADIHSNTVSAEISGLLRGGADVSAQIVHDACESLPRITDAALPQLLFGQTGSSGTLPVSPAADTEVSSDTPGVFPGNLTEGQTVTFGTWEQDGDAANGPEPMEWRVLAVENGRALLITKKGVDVVTYNTSPPSYTVWESCALREWLNGEFLEAAFTAEERTAILETTLEESVNEKYLTSSGNSTRDRVFILSFQEAERYFRSEDDRTCYPTEYAAGKNGWPTVGYGVCWTRTPGEDQYHEALIGEMGNLFYEGWWVHNEDALVRPAVWVGLG